MAITSPASPEPKSGDLALASSVSASAKTSLRTTWPERRISLTHREPRRPIASGTTVLLTGRAPGGRRPVEIQRRTGAGHWQKVEATRSSNRGEFAVRLQARRGLVLRSFAPARRGTKATRSTPHTLDVVRPTGTLTAIPPLAAPGPRPEVPTTTAQVLATFTPALPGEAVVLQRRTASGWRIVALGKQNLSGTVAFPATPGSVYRAAASPQAITAPVTARSFDLLFADDFTAPGPDDRAPDASRWSDQYRADVPARTCSTNSPAPRSVAGGVLNLRAILDPTRLEACPYIDPTTGVAGLSPYLLNSQVGTPKTFSFTYGYAAARMKMHANPGAHAAFWLLPTKTVPDGLPEWHDVAYVPGDPSKGAEIDVVEYWANPRGIREPDIGSFLHWYEVDGTQAAVGGMALAAARLRPPEHTWDNAFHVFAVRWTPTSYEFMVDGQVYATETRAVSQVPQYLVLSMLAANYEIGRATPALFEDAAKVDWVRVWGL